MMVLNLHSRWAVLVEMAANVVVAAQGTFHTWSSVTAAAAAGKSLHGDGALAAVLPLHWALGRGHPKLRCFALGSLMGMWCW